MLLTGPCFHGKKRIATTFNRCISIFEEGPFRGGKKVHPQWIKVVSPIFGSKPGRCHNGPWHTAWLHPRTVTWSGWMRRDGNDSNVAFQGSQLCKIFDDDVCVCVRVPNSNQKNLTWSWIAGWPGCWAWLVSVSAEPGLWTLAVPSFRVAALWLWVWVPSDFYTLLLVLFWMNTNLV